MATGKDGKGTSKKTDKAGTDGKKDLVLRVSPELHEYVTSAAKRWGVPTSRLGTRALSYGMDRACSELEERYRKLVAIESEYQDDEAGAEKEKAKVRGASAGQVPSAPGAQAAQAPRTDKPQSEGAADQARDEAKPQAPSAGKEAAGAPGSAPGR